MDAASVWVECLRELAVEAQEYAWHRAMSARGRLKVAHVRGWDGDAAAAARVQAEAHRAGIIAREAYRQWAAAVEAVRLRGLPMKPSAHDVRTVAAWAEMACLVADES